MNRMERASFDEIRFKDLCAQAEITEPTFYNYFPSKDLLLVHIILLWGIALEHQARQIEERESPLRVIEAIFARAAAQMMESPRVASELLVLQARRVGPPRFPEISPADRLLWYPQLRRIERIPALGILGILKPRVEAARAAGELPQEISTDLILRALFSVFLGVPVALRWQDPEKIQDAYREQLEILWKGLRTP